MASYVTGEHGGDCDSDDNLQWLKHGPHDKTQTLAPVVGSRSLQGGGNGVGKEQRSGYCAPRASEANEEGNDKSCRKHGERFTAGALL